MTKDFVPNPLIEIILTSILFVQIGSTFYFFRNDSMAWVGIIVSIIVIVAIWLTKKLAEIIGGYISSNILGNHPFNNPLKKPRNREKFVAQSWQFVIHVSMTIFELYILSGEDWLEHPHNCMLVELEKDSIRWVYKEEHVLLSWFVKIQLAIWVWTCVSHRFLEEKHKDYYVMYLHHVCTIALVLAGYVWRFDRLTLVVLYIHDASDIFIDLLKLTNYLKLEDKAGFFLTEISYVSSMVFWMYYRLYLFPVYFTFYGGFPTSHINWPTTNGKPGLAGNLYSEKFIQYMTEVDIAERDMQYYYVGPVCNTLFLMLLCMHVWWFFLLGRIGYKIVMGIKKPNDAGKDEYEGSSGSEDEDDKKD